MEQRVLSVSAQVRCVHGAGLTPQTVFSGWVFTPSWKIDTCRFFPSSTLALNITTKKKEGKGFSHCRLPRSTWQCFSL